MNEAETRRAALDAALAKCRETHTGINPCRDHAYLVARHAYHRLLVEAGRLAPGLAERNPEPRR